MRRFVFHLSNLTNDTLITITGEVTSKHIEEAIKLHGIGYDDIGIFIVELEGESSAEDLAKLMLEAKRSGE